MISHSFHNFHSTLFKQHFLPNFRETEFRLLTVWNLRKSTLIILRKNHVKLTFEIKGELISRILSSVFRLEFFDRFDEKMAIEKKKNISKFDTHSVEKREIHCHPNFFRQINKQEAL